MMRGNKSLGFGLIGAGIMGNNHARILSDFPEAELVGLYDIDYQRSSLLAEAYNTTAYKDLEELLDKNLDAVVIAVPTGCHRDISILSARAGMNILLEKPIANTLEDAEAILEECEKNNVGLMVGFVERFNPVIHAIKERILLEDVVAIDFERVGPIPPRVKDVGVVIDLATHDIDLLRYLTGREIISKHTVVSHNGGRYEDYARLTFILEGDIIAHITTNWITPYKSRMIRVSSRSIFLEGDLLRKTLHIWDPPEASSTGNRIPISLEEPLRREIEAFVRCIRSGCDFPITGDDAFKTLEIAHACLESASRVSI